MCGQGENVNVTAAPRPQFLVSANKSVYVTEWFDHREDAVARLVELAGEDYDAVSLRDNSQDGAW